MNFGTFSFGSIEIDGKSYEHDVVVDRGRIRKRKKKASQKFREQFGHTPLSLEEEIPWKCRRLIVGSGKYGELPVMKEVKREAQRRDVDITILPTDAAIKELGKNPAKTNAILHVTC
ncbi:MAG: MTH938/NDUFAF3 family protein [Candidatus Binatus sp.]